MSSTLIRFRTLQQRGIIPNRVTLKRRIDRDGFPKPIRLGENSVAWIEAEVDAWLQARAAERDAPKAA
jgi:prophage regulatory protein